MKDIGLVIIVLLVFFIFLGFALKILLKRPLKEIISDIISYLTPW